MSFKKGDRVRIREWDDMAEEYGTDGWGITVPGEDNLIALDMKKYCGKEAKVAVCEKGEYTLEIDDEYWWWPECALIPVEEREEPAKKNPKQKYQLTQPINPERFLQAVERYVNTEKYPSLDVALAILGIEKVGE